MINIYLIINKAVFPNMFYVGKTRNSLEERFQEHVYETGLLGKAIIYYGTRNFAIELLEIDNTIEESYKKEDFYIKKFKSHFKDGNGYNMKYETSENGVPLYESLPDNIKSIVLENIKCKRAWNFGIKCLPEIKNKIKETRKHRSLLGKYKDSYGHKHTEKTKKIISSIKKDYYKTHNPHNKCKWEVIFPDGTKETIHDLHKWCKEHMFNYSCVRSAAQKRYKTRNGYVFKKIG